MISDFKFNNLIGVFNKLKKESIYKLLEKLGFSKKEHIYKKKYNDKILEIDIKSESIKYSEEKKFKYFSLCLGQKVTIIKTGEKQEEKDFLGYEWSNRKGNEGIKFYEDTKLYDESRDYSNLQKANSYIRGAFLGKDISIDENLKENVSKYDLIDMIDFKKIDFDLAISLSKSERVDFTQIWNTDELVLLSEISEIRKGSSITKKQVKSGNIPVVAGGKSPAYYHNQSNREGNVITVSASGANAGYVNYFEIEIFASDCSTIQANSDNITKYIFICLQIIQEEIYKLQRGQAQPHVYPKDLENLPIPLLDKTIQQKIVDEIEYIEKNGIDFPTSNISKYQEEVQKIKNNILDKYLK